MADLFAGAVVRVPLRDQIACVAREVALRRNVYRGFVASGRMTAEKAEHELACMAAVLATLQELEMGAANEPQEVGDAG